MSFLSKFENWAQKFKPYLIGYKNDFFELYYHINSPIDMMQRFRSMPFVDFCPTQQRIITKTPFINLTCHYRSVNDDLFILYCQSEYKTNVCFKYYLDPNKPADYYCLTLRTNHTSKQINSLANGISYPDNSWLFYKPGAKVNHHHFKGTKGAYISLYFKREWLEKCAEEEGHVELRSFLASENDHVICPYFEGTALYDVSNLNELMLEQNPTIPDNFKHLEIEMMEMLSFFKLKMQTEQINDRHFTINNTDRLKVLKAEQILKAHLYKKFPGITYLSKETGLSETKLKECFRLVYDQTLLQYLQRIQMEKAKEMLLQTDINIGTVAQKFSYENPSKFAAAFRKYHTHLPSELKHHFPEATSMSN
jgi:AraC-like DNA-binding protein